MAKLAWFETRRFAALRTMRKGSWSTTHDSRFRDQGRGNSGGAWRGIAVMAEAADLHDADRGRGAPPAPRALRRHAAAVRSDGPTRQGARRHDAVGYFQTNDGFEWQRHGPGRAALRIRP